MTKTWKRRWVVAQYSTLYLFRERDEGEKAKAGVPSLVIDLSEYSKATVVESSRSGILLLFLLLSKKKKKRKRNDVRHLQILLLSSR